MKKKLLSAVMTLALLASVVGCGSGSQSAAGALDQQGVSEIPATEATTETAETTEEAAPAAAIDLSEQVDLVFYVMGDAPQDEELVEEALNEKLLE